MPVDVKICGVSTADAIAVAAEHGASHVGFVFYPPSPRHLELDRARRLAAFTPKRLRRVGVFVAPEPDFVRRAVEAAALDAVQVHRTDRSTLETCRATLDVELWAAVPVADRHDLAELAGYAGIADRLLYDAKTPPDALPGGLGMSFDWSLLADVAHPLPWALSGGLDRGNVAAAIRATGARLVDVSSGVESAPGVKDMDKIVAFLNAARHA